MKAAAIVKARNRLARAQEALNQARAAPNFETFAPHWEDFLHSLNAVPLILEPGAKNNPKSRQWYGGKKAWGRKDPLLRYLFQARNADEHGIEPIVAHEPGGVAMGIEQGIVVHSMTIGPHGIVGNVETTDGEPLRVKIVPPQPKLIPVYDERFGGQWFDPPTEHKGQALQQTGPVDIGQIGLDYYRALVSEAESYC